MIDRAAGAAMRPVTPYPAIGLLLTRGQLQPYFGEGPAAFRAGDHPNGRGLAGLFS